MNQSGVNNPFYGKKHTKESIELIRKASVGRVHSIESRINRSNAVKGYKHYNWQGGLTGINFQIRNSLEYRLWREAVFKRDKYTCQECGARNGSGKTIVLHADHIKRFADYPELRFDIDNGRTLCKPCHRKTNTYGGIKKT